MFTYSGEPLTGIPNSAAPNLLNTSYTVTADIEVPEGIASGMIVGWTVGRVVGAVFLLLNAVALSLI